MLKVSRRATTEAGIRCLVLDGHARTRTVRQLPNVHAWKWFAEHGEMPANLDGELMV
jgi:hypothetical protein